MFVLSATLRFLNSPSGEGGLAGLVRAVRREWRIRRDVAYLASVEDRMLHDIGMQRGEVERYVRSGRALDRTNQRRRKASLATSWAGCSARYRTSPQATA
jgi:uncharacterized protein YjiS (DUF1127 family)